MADNVDHTHGDTGSKPPQNLNFQDGGLPDPQEFDWFWSQVPAAINNHASLIESIDSDEDGVVDTANVANNATNYKNNDIDSDGDGKVDSADNADTLDGTELSAFFDSAAQTPRAETYTSLADVPNSAATGSLVLITGEDPSRLYVVGQG